MPYTPQAPDNDYGGLTPGQVSDYKNVKPQWQQTWESVATSSWGQAMSSTSFNSMMDNMFMNPAWQAAVNVYGTKFTSLYAEASMTQGSNADQWLQGQMMANGMGPQDPKFAAELKRLGTGGPGSRGPGGGGSGPSKAQQYAAAEAAIRNQAMTLGYVTFGDANIKSLAQTAVNGNWSNDQLTDYLVNDATKHWDKLQGGTLKGGAQQIGAAAAQQLIKISEATARQWAKRMASGELDATGLASMLQDQAIAKWGWAADSIKRGVTMADFLAPSRDRIAETLELQPESVNLMDDRYSKMLTVVDTNGKTRAATDAEVLSAARKDTRWATTNNARELTAAAAQRLRDYFEGN